MFKKSFHLPSNRPNMTPEMVLVFAQLTKKYLHTCMQIVCFGTFLIIKSKKMNLWFEIIIFCKFPRSLTRLVFNATKFLSSKFSGSGTFKQCSEKASKYKLSLAFIYYFIVIQLGYLTPSNQT